MAVRDPLTGAYNRRGFTELATRELERARRSASSVGIVAGDLDNLKEINDRYGHAAGDRVIRTLVQRWQDALREVDVIGRMGGDELVALLPDADLRGALAAAERLLDRTRREPVDVRRARLFVTVSLGVAAETAPSDLDRLLVRADEALYRAKRRGRNRLAT